MKKVGSISAVIYTGISVLAAGLFLLSTISGQYTLVERIGGAAWVFLLSMIILMPIVTPLVKRKLGENRSQAK
jgi:putative exporter of polyketide antibiotics